MSCAWFLEHVEAYALGALDPADRARLERHLEETGEHDGCVEALAEALDVVAALDDAASAPVTPRPAVWSLIEATLDDQSDQDRPASRPSRVTPLPSAEGRAASAEDRAAMGLREMAGWGLAIAASALLWFFWQARTDLLARIEKDKAAIAALEHGDRDRDRRLAEAERERTECRAVIARAREAFDVHRTVLRMLDDPESRIVPFAPQVDLAMRATAIIDPLGRTFVVSGTMQPVSGKDFQLWVIRGKAAPVPAGFVRFAADGTAIGEFDAAVLAGGAPDALAVSLENTGGSRTPTEVVFVAAVKPT